MVVVDHGSELYDDRYVSDTFLQGVTKKKSLKLANK